LKFAHCPLRGKNISIIFDKKTLFVGFGQDWIVGWVRAGLEALAMMATLSRFEINDFEVT
jgi:hypothetical protein